MAESEHEWGYDMAGFRQAHPYRGRGEEEEREEGPSPRAEIEERRAFCECYPPTSHA